MWRLTTFPPTFSQDRRFFGGACGGVQRWLRRSLFRTSSDLAAESGDVRWAIEGGWRGARTLLATAGDRLALHRIVWSTGDAGARSEIEVLHVDEVDGEGRLLRSLMFDPDDRAAAFREIGHRYLGITRPSALPRHEALRDAGRDLARFRTALPDDFFFHDHRRTGLGRLDSADAYLASVAALHELAPDAVVGQPLYHLADEPHGMLSIAHSFGTLADGGPFESPDSSLARWLTTLFDSPWDCVAVQTTCPREIAARATMRNVTGSASSSRRSPIHTRRSVSAG